MILIILKRKIQQVTRLTHLKATVNIKNLNDESLEICSLRRCGGVLQLVQLTHPNQHSAATECIRASAAHV